MGTQPFRVKQTSITTGTGTLTVIAPPAGLRSLNTHYGVGPVMVPYLIQGPQGLNPTYFEQGFGSFTNASSQLTRPAANVVLGSAGAGVNVNLPSGTHDVFVWLPPWWAPVVTVTATQNLALGAVGSLHEFTGASAADLDLPALANVPDGFCIPFVHAGTAIWSFDPNASELIQGVSTSLAIYPGESGLLYRSSAGWRVAFNKAGPILLQEQVASAVATVDFTKFIDASFSQILFELSGVAPATAAATLNMRVSEDAGGSWKSGASDYGHTRTTNSNGSAASVGGTFSDSAIVILPLGNGANDSFNGEVRWFAPSASGRWKSCAFAGASIDATFASLAVAGGAYKGSTNPINGVRFLMSSGNIATGTFRLWGLRKV